jgi:hypothetical protein
MPINAVQVNANGGIYSNGKGHRFEKKLEVYLMLKKLKKQKLEEGDLRPVTHRALASASKVSTKFARKVMAEANAGALIDRAEEKKWKKKTTNPGAKTITGLIDKFSDKNIERTVEFVNYIRRLNPSRVKFGDEKHLKGKEMFDRKVRKCPVTGKVEEVVVDRFPEHLQHRWVLWY